MSMKTNKSILECPACDKPLVNIASKVTRTHPLARFIQNYNFTIVVVSGFIATVIMMLSYAFGFFESRRGFGFVWFTLLFFPSFIMYFLLRIFNLYRVTDCPYCGYHDEQKLGRSSAG